MAVGRRLSVPAPSKLPPPTPINTRKSPEISPVLFPPEEGTPPRRIALIGGSAVAILLLALIVWKFWPSKSPAVGANMGVLTISSSPSGATVEVNDQSCITPNCGVQLAPGDYKLKASLSGYASDSRTVHVDSGSATPPIEVALKPLPNSVHISTNFASATVALDNNRAGSLHQGQLNLADVPAGSA